MIIAVINGMGGGIGAQIVTQLRRNWVGRCGTFGRCMVI